MRLLPLALAAAALCASQVQAQSSVTVFGLIDVNYARLSGDGNGSLKLLGNDGYQSTRIGFRGTEDLGGGMSASFWLEGAFTPDDGRGAAGGALNFARRSTVSLTDSWGELRVGRDYVPGFWNLSVFNPFGTNGVGSSGFLFYPVQAAARTTHVRSSNSIGYFLPKMSGFYGQAMYGVGENASNSGATAKDGEVLGWRVGYAAGPVDVAVASTKTKISAVGDLTQTNVGGKYNFGVATAMMLWNENKVGATKTRTYLLGGLVPTGSAGQVRLAYSSVKTSGVANNANQWALGYVHTLSKRTALYANYARISNKNGGTNYNVGHPTTTAGGSSSGYELGLRHSF